jgi:hypothetical protein
MLQKYDSASSKTLFFHILATYLLQFSKRHTFMIFRTHTCHFHSFAKESHSNPKEYACLRTKIRVYMEIWAMSNQLIS